jgi:sensor histidine kinase YesM
MLLNSFNMIYNLAESKEFQKIQDYSFHLMNFFRYALRRSENSVTLENELKFVRDYLEVQKIRYPGMLHSNYYVEPGLEKIVVPPFIIQSFVENSVMHGMVIGHEMESYVEIVKEGDHVIISISDNGAGISEERLTKILQEEPITDKTGTHIGIWNSIRRLRLYYGADTLSVLIADQEKELE